MSMKKELIVGISNYDETEQTFSEDYYEILKALELNTPVYILNKEQVNKLKEFIEEMEEYNNYYREIIDFIMNEFDDVNVVGEEWDEEGVFYVTKVELEEAIEKVISKNSDSEYYLVFSYNLSEDELFNYPLSNYSKILNDLDWEYYLFDDYGDVVSFDYVNRYEVIDENVLYADDLITIYGYVLKDEDTNKVDNYLFVEVEEGELSRILFNNVDELMDEIEMFLDEMDIEEELDIDVEKLESFLSKKN